MSPIMSIKLHFFKMKKVLEIDCTITTYSSHSYTRHLKNVKMVNFMCYFTTIKKCLDINEKKKPPLSLSYGYNTSLGILLNS